MPKDVFVVAKLLLRDDTMGQVVQHALSNWIHLFEVCVEGVVVQQVLKIIVQESWHLCQTCLCAEQFHGHQGIFCTESL